MKKIISIFIVFVSIITLYGCYDTETTLFTLENVENQITELYEELSPMTVAVVSYTDETMQTKAGHGSGLIYDREETETGYLYYVITNYHVVDSQAYLKIYDGSYYDANLYAVHEPEDLALVTFETTLDLPYFGTEQFDGDVYAKPSIGSYVLAIGTPLDLEFYNTATLGIVGQTSNPKVIQHDASINPGNSGGPLFDLNGNLLGINTWKRASTMTVDGEIAVEGIGFAISMPIVISVINNLRSNQVSVFAQPKIGVTITTVELAITEIYGGTRPDFIEETQINGLVVLTVIPLRPAVGIMMVNDIITHVNETEIITIQDLANVLVALDFGDTIDLTIRRYQNETFETINVTITL